MSGRGQTSAPQGSEQEEKKNKAVIILIIILLLVVLIAAGIIIYLLTREDDQPDDSPSDGRGTVVTEDNLEDILNATQNPDSSYTTSMSLDWHFQGKTSKDAYVENLTDNSRTVYFDLKRADTGEVIYSSPFIPLGEKLNGVTLDQELEPGTYDTILTYHLVDDNEKELTTLSVELTIYVE